MIADVGTGVSASRGCRRQCGKPVEVGGGEGAGLADGLTGLAGARAEATLPRALPRRGIRYCRHARGSTDAPNLGRLR